MDSPPHQLSRCCRDSTLQESQNPWQAPHNNLSFNHLSCGYLTWLCDFTRGYHFGPGADPEEVCLPQSLAGAMGCATDFLWGHPFGFGNTSKRGHIGHHIATFEEHRNPKAKVVVDITGSSIPELHSGKRLHTY